MKKSLLFFIIFVVLVFSPAGYAFGESHINNEEDATSNLEIEYPRFGDYYLERTTTTLPDFVRYIFYFFIIAGGIIALVLIVIAGLRYVSSYGDPGKLQGAKDMIYSALLGLVVLLVSFLILNTISPKLITLDLKPIAPIMAGIPEGVLLCRTNVANELNELAELRERYDSLGREGEEERTPETVQPIIDQVEPLLAKIKENCLEIDHATASANWPLEDMNVPGICATVGYGAAVIRLTETGEVESFILTPSLTAAKCGRIGFYPESITPFVVMEGDCVNCTATIYEAPNYNRGYDENEKDSEPYPLNFPAYCTPPLFNPWSIKITGEMLVILIKGGNDCRTGSMSLRESNTSNLSGLDPIIEWVPCEDISRAYQGRQEGETCAVPAVDSMLLLHAQTY